MRRPRPDPLGRAVAAALGLPAPKRPKYRNIKDTRDGARFDSKGEARRWDELRLLERAGAIADLRRQVPVPLVVNDTLVATLVLDFAYRENGADVWEDFKSPATLTPAWRLKARLAEAIHRRPIRISGVDQGHGASVRSRSTTARGRGHV